ncbi:hypothetical protein SAMN04488044_0776 [Cognatishimia maritima]|uniref:Clp protease n=2 Tax=Cognatishimia maritima TaxID=870908 RepID=A0A1M5JTW2_9RHOB|nr:hypothetical protein SAMN04488044_0776 [Cognatishimia maritima]
MSAITTNFQKVSPSFTSGFWLSGVLLRVGLTATMIGLSFLPPLMLPLLAAALGIDLISFLWSLVRYHAAAGLHLQQTGRFWSVVGGYCFFFVALVAMIFSWWMLSQGNNLEFLNRDGKDTKENVAPERGGRFEANFSRDRRELMFNGVVAQGAIDDFVENLTRSDRLETIVLNSPGGNIYEARLMAKEVKRLGLNTHVTNECSASCLLIFMAGTERTLGPGGQLGVHRYGMDFTQVLPHVSPLREMRTDQQYYLDRGVTLDFLDKVFDLSRDAIWYPTRHELTVAGMLTR